MIVVLMGVSGSGKTTVGALLAAKLHWQFADADAFHPPSNVQKMKRGEPLTDEDRHPWLQSLREHIDAACEANKNFVLACSALKHEYRDYLRADQPACVHFVYLEGSEDLIRHRLANRAGHFMPPSLLHSQFESLEPPHHALRVDITPAPEVIVEQIIQRLKLVPGEFDSQSAGKTEAIKRD
jgi:gluconokinase